MPSLESMPAFLSAFTLVGLLEVGDKSQLVCMTLAARHRHWPVLLGAGAAFCVLNALAVVFGAAIGAWMPERAVAALVALMFALFGIHLLASGDDEQAGAAAEKPGRSIFLTTFLLIVVAEFGDKTQIAVAGLAAGAAPLPVWAGATVALVMVSALGVWAGRKVLRRLPARWMRRAGGLIFLVFAAAAAWHTLG